MVGSSRSTTSHPMSTVLRQCTQRLVNRRPASVMPPSLPSDSECLSALRAPHPPLPSRHISRLVGATLWPNRASVSVGHVVVVVVVLILPLEQTRIDNMTWANQHTSITTNQCNSSSSSSSNASSATWRRVLQPAGVTARSVDNSQYTARSIDPVLSRRCQDLSNERVAAATAAVYRAALFY